MFFFYSQYGVKTLNTEFRNFFNGFIIYFVLIEKYTESDFGVHLVAHLKRLNIMICMYSKIFRH